MGTSVIDGTVEEVVVRRAAKKATVYKTLKFRLDDGSTRTVKGMAAEASVAETLVPGSHGRFYLFTSFDIKGVHGARLGDGRDIYGFPGNNKMIFLFLGIVNVAWVALKLATTGDVPLLGVALTILAVVGFVMMGKGQTETKAQFDADSVFRTAAIPGI